MMLRSRANEIPALVGQLGSRSPQRIDAARARLSIIGPRAVDDLIEALEGTNNRIRSHAMPLLAMIQDPRGREPLLAMLLDRNPRLRLIATRSLSRFPAADVVAGLNRTLDRERRPEIRVAAVQSLVEQYAAGQESAIRRVLDLLLDPEEWADARVAAFALLRSLHSSQRRSILKRLTDDPDRRIRRAAESYGASAESRTEADLREWLLLLGSDDHAAWSAAVQRLSGWAAAVIPPLLERMRERANDPEFCTRAGMVLKALGPRRGRAVADALDSIDEPLPLQALVDVIGAFGEKALIYRLKDLIDRLADAESAATGANSHDLLVHVRARAHLELARIGSRVAIRDLRTCLSNHERRVDLEMLEAVELIGKRDEISVLLRAYGREDEVVRERVAKVVRTIMRRERIRRNAKILNALPADQRLALESILPRLPARPRLPGGRSRARTRAS